MDQGVGPNRLTKRFDAGASVAYLPTSVSEAPKMQGTTSTSGAFAPTLMNEVRKFRTPHLFEGFKPALYGVGITAWVWFENVLSFPAPSTAVVT